MSGRLVYSAPPRHRCAPPDPAPSGKGLLVTYREGDVWRCDCGRLWVCRDEPDRGRLCVVWPWSLTWRRAGLLTRWRYRKAR